MAGQWSHFMRKRESGLPMNLPEGLAAKKRKKHKKRKAFDSAPLVLFSGQSFSCNALGSWSQLNLRRWYSKGLAR
jgi:hypothetical protein